MQFTKKIQRSLKFCPCMLLAAGCATTQVDAQEHQKHCRTDPECEHFYSDLSRQSVMSATALQAIRGRELESTLWNHHFVSPTDELTPSGRALLHRLARKDRGMPMQIFIQTANDLPFEDGELLEYSEQINELNKKRAKKVNDYITIVLKRSPPSLFVYDRTPEGMWAYEATGVYNMLKSSGRGVLNPNAVSGYAGDASDRPEIAPENSAGSSAGGND